MSSGEILGPDEPFARLLCPTDVAPRMSSDAMRLFFDEHYRDVLGAVTLVTGSRAVAEDAVNEAVARAWERGERIQQLNRWVLTVALNIARNRWRRTRREVPEQDMADGTVEPANPTLIDLRLALRGLPTRQREVVVLYYLLDLPVAEVAEGLGLSPRGREERTVPCASVTRRCADERGGGRIGDVGSRRDVAGSASGAGTRAGNVGRRDREGRPRAPGPAATATARPVRRGGRGSSTACRRAGDGAGVERRPRCRRGGIFYTTQGTEQAIQVCESRHFDFQPVRPPTGSVDLYIPAAWMAPAFDPNGVPIDNDVRPEDALEPGGTPGKIVGCGPYEGYIQYSIWAPASDDLADVNAYVTNSNRLVLEIRP